MFNAKNITIAALLTIIISYAGFVGYSAWRQVPVEPDAPVLILNKDKFEIGDQIQLTVKHNRSAKYSVSWAVLDNYHFKNDYTSYDQNIIMFGTGPKDKTLLVIANVNYLVDNEIKSYTLTALVKIGALPPPIPPPVPNPPTPPSPVIFPDEVYKLSSFSYSEFSKLNHPKRVELAKGFAGRLDSMVAAINAGTKADSETALKELNSLNNQTLTELGVDRSVVVPYFSALTTKLVEIDNQVGFERLDNLRRAFIEISTGLKAVK